LDGLNGLLEIKNKSKDGETTKMSDRQDFRTLANLKYGEIEFTTHHLIIAKALKNQGRQLHELEEELSILNIHIFSFDKVNFELEKLKLSTEDQDLVQVLIDKSPDWVPSDSAIRAVQHSKIIELSDRLNSIFLNVSILATTLLEALINLYLSIKCVESKKQEIFGMIESADIKRKWQSAPIVFLDGYELLFNSSPGQELKELIDIRNAFIHYKPTVIDTGNGQEISGVNVDKEHIRKYAEKLRKIKAFLGLPKQLLAHLHRYGENAQLVGLLGDSIGLSDEDKREVFQQDCPTQ
jgi:hypothetical protein